MPKGICFYLIFIKDQYIISIDLGEDVYLACLLFYSKIILFKRKGDFNHERFNSKRK